MCSGGNLDKYRKSIYFTQLDILDAGEFGILDCLCDPLGQINQEIFPVWNNHKATGNFREGWI